MAGQWSSRRLLAIGVPLLVAGLAVFAWEQTSEQDIELLSLPLLLVGLFLAFEGAMAWRRERLARADNDK